MTLAIAAEVTPATQQPDSTRHAKLVHAAQQFEAVLLGELMKPLSTSTAIGSEDEGQPNALQGFGVEAMAGAMARSGALGFASRIVRSVEQREGSGNLSQKSTESSQVIQQPADNPSGGN